MCLIISWWKHLSAAFDTIDNIFNVSRLRDMYGIHAQALSWIRSYLSDRLQRVNIKGALSDRQELQYGVSNGSVREPMLWCLYTKPVSVTLSNVLDNLPSICW